MVLATPVYSPFNYLTWLLAGEYFIECIIALGDVLKSHGTCLVTCTWVHPEFIILKYAILLASGQRLHLSIL